MMFYLTFAYYFPPRPILCRSKLAELSLLSPYWVAHVHSFRRWEVPIEGVILDGQLLPTANIFGSGSNLSARYCDYFLNASITS